MQLWLRSPDLILDSLQSHWHVEVKMWQSLGDRRTRC